MNLDEYRSGSAEPWTVDLLCAMIRAKKPHIVVETGTFEGRTACAFMTAMNSYADEHASVLYTVESDEARHTAAYERMQAHATTIQSAVGVRAILGDALALLTGADMQKAVDFVFLDDDHTAAHVHSELKFVAQVLRPGGICCVHDVVGPFGLDEVVQSYGGIIFDLPRLHAAGGLGVIVKR